MNLVDALLTSEDLFYDPILDGSLGNINDVAEAMEKGPPQNVLLTLDDILSEEDINTLLQAMVNGKKTFFLTTKSIFSNSNWDLLMKLVETQRLYQLFINNNNITPARLAQLVSALNSITRGSLSITLKTFKNWVRVNPPIDGIAQIISRVSDFDWDGKLTDQDAFQIAQTIEQSPFLKNLHLSLNTTGLSDKGVQRLLEAFQNTKTLTDFKIDTYGDKKISSKLLDQFVALTNERTGSKKWLFSNQRNFLHKVSTIWKSKKDFLIKLWLRSLRIIKKNSKTESNNKINDIVTLKGVQHVYLAKERPKCKNGFQLEISPSITTTARKRLTPFFTADGEMILPGRYIILDQPVLDRNIHLKKDIVLQCR